MPDHLDLGPHRLRLGGVTHVMGVINLSPDSKNTHTVARSVAAPTELPVGVVTAFVGVPFFVWLLRRSSA